MGLLQTGMPVVALWGALRRVAGRQWGRTHGIVQNNFFVFVAVMIYGNVSYGLEPQSAYFFVVLLGVLLLMPSSGDPMARIPAGRLALWPLEERQLGVFRILGLLLRPGFWVLVVVIWRSASVWAALGFVGLGLLVQMGTGGLKRWGGTGEWMRWVPGVFGILVLKNLRELLTQLDVYLALLLAVGGLCVRLMGGGDSGPMLGLMVGLGLSTVSQGGFGMEGAAGETRYRIWPVAGWYLWGAKDLAYLLVLGVLTLPLGLGSGGNGPALGMGLIVLAVRHLFGREVVPQAWRFSGGVLWPMGLVQTVGGLGAGVWVYRWGNGVLLLSLLIYVGALVYAGWRWERWAETN
jgi:hypothetical protein